MKTTDMLLALLGAVVLGALASLGLCKAFPASDDQIPVRLIPPTVLASPAPARSVTRGFLRPPLAPIPSPTSDPAGLAAGGAKTPTPSRSGLSPVTPGAGPDGERGSLPKVPRPAPKARIAWCESRNNPTAVNHSSGASGLYQFLDSTWHSVTGLPGKAANYPAAVQSAAFDALYAQEGTRPWTASERCWR